MYKKPQQKMISVMEKQYFRDFGLSYLESQWRKIREWIRFFKGRMKHTVFMILEQDKKETIWLNIYVLTGDTL